MVRPSLPRSPSRNCGLPHGAGVAVQDAAPGHVGAGQPLLDHGVGDVVGDQAAAVHDGLDALADLGAARLVVAEHVAGGDVRDGEGAGQHLGLGPLPGAGGAEQDQDHGVTSCAATAGGPAAVAAQAPTGWPDVTVAAAQAGATRTGEALVVPGDEVRLDLLHGVEGHADDDEQRGAAEVEGDVELVGEDGRQHADGRQVDRAAEGDAGEHVVDVARRSSCRGGCPGCSRRTSSGCPPRRPG